MNIFIELSCPKFTVFEPRPPECVKLCERHTDCTGNSVCCAVNTCSTECMTRGRRYFSFQSYMFYQNAKIDLPFYYSSSTTGVLEFSLTFSIPMSFNTLCCSLSTFLRVRWWRMSDVSVFGGATAMSVMSLACWISSTTQNGGQKWLSAMRLLRNTRNEPQRDKCMHGTSILFNVIIFHPAPRIMV